ncbi:MAG TPA: Ig-like domain-containing protein [Candidatus Kryptonia bacterium]
MGIIFISKLNPISRWLPLIAVTILVSGCTKNNNPAGDTGSLSDPSVKPAVIFTLPANGGTGPFNVFNPGDGTARPSFVVQFNKLMNTYAIKTGAITCKGFDRAVAVVPHSAQNVIYPPYSNRNSKSEKKLVPTALQVPDKPASFDDVVELDVVDSVNYAIGNGYHYQLPYVVGRTYTVTLDTSLQDINGNHLQSPYTFSFTPEPKFRVITGYPSNGDKNVSITDANGIELIFNSPIEASTLAQISITPALQGKWFVYSSDSTRAYFSSPDTLEYNTLYTVNVPAAVSDNYGHQLGTAYSESFMATPFQVFSFYPSDGSTGIGTTYTVGVNMTGAIDTTTLRPAFSISPNVAGSLQYFGQSPSSFSFIPSVAFGFNTKYTVSLSTALKSTNGTHMIAPFSSTFTTMPFEVTSSYPSDGSTGILSAQSVQVAFSGPIDTNSILHAFSISPSLAGSFSVNGNNNGFTFTPTSALAMGTTYTVTVSTVMKAQDGTSLPSAYTFSFSTTPFQVSYTNPQDGATNWPQYQGISVDFNGNIDTSSAEMAFSISPPVTGAISFNYYYPTAAFNFTPSSQFVLGTTYKVTISTAMKSQGGSNLPAPYSFSFATIPFTVTSIYPSNGSYGSGRSTNVEVDCNAPIDTSTIRTAFSLSPSVSGRFTYYNGGTISSFTFFPATSLAANTQYTVTVSTALKSSDGTPLSKSYSSTFTTGQY